MSKRAVRCVAARVAPAGLMRQSHGQSAQEITMKKLLLTTAVLVALIAPAMAGQIDVPVMAGGDLDWDACGSSGTVMGLNPRGDGFLAVKSGPGLQFTRIDRVYNGQHVTICDQRGVWYGVVYSLNGRDCGVNSPWRVRMPYTGPCRYGWIHSSYVGDLAAPFQIRSATGQHRRHGGVSGGGKGRGQGL